MWRALPYGDCSDFKAIEQPVAIDVSELDSGRHSVALNIVESICVELAGDDGSVNVLRLLLFEESTDVARQLLVYVPEDVVYLSAALNDLRAPILMPFRYTGSCGSGFERMAERAVADIVQQSGEKRDSLPFVVTTPTLPTCDDIGELACRMIDTDAVRKTAVRRTGKDQVREA